MTTFEELPPILMTDDDKGDCVIVEKALRKNQVANPLVFLSNGEELLEYLERKGKYSSPGLSVRPCLVLLDLNMPRMNGHEALQIIKSHENLRKIPVVVFTSSLAEEDVLRSYSEGANSYIQKPDSFDKMLATMESLKDYWLKLSVIPKNN